MNRISHFDVEFDVASLKASAVSVPKVSKLKGPLTLMVGASLFGMDYMNYARVSFDLLIE